MTCKACEQNRTNACSVHLYTWVPALFPVMQQGEALVESVGTEDRGLSDELISYLQPWKYKAVKGSGFFSRKTNHEK